MERIKNKKLQNLFKGIIKENPLFVSVLGTCPALATTTSIEGAIGMGILFSIVLICSNILISLLRKLISEEITTPAYIVVIAAFVTIVKLFSNAFLFELYSTLGVFISLIVVNCIVLGRAEAYASKNNVLDSLLDAIGMGIGYTLALLSISCIREILGSGMISFGKILTFIPRFDIPILKYVNSLGEVVYDYSIPLFVQPSGAFIVFGVILAVISAITSFKNTRKKIKEKIMLKEAK